MVSFVLDVNGMKVINRNVLYRKNLQATWGPGKVRKKTTKTKITRAMKTTLKKYTKFTPTLSDGGGLLGLNLSGILGGTIRRDGAKSMANSAGTTSTASMTSGDSNELFIWHPVCKGNISQSGWNFLQVSPKTSLECKFTNGVRTPLT